MSTPIQYFDSDPIDIRLHTMSAPIQYFDSDPRDTRLQMLMPNGKFFREEIAELVTAIQSIYWVASEVVLRDDVTDYEKMDIETRRMLDSILGLFAVFDGLVNRDVIGNFKSEIPFMEAKMFYALQEANECIHGVMYSRLITTYNQSQESRAKEILNSVQMVPEITALVDWVSKNLDPSLPLPHRMIISSLIEGPIFQINFAIIGLFREKPKYMEGLIFSNDLISRDEFLHLRFTQLMYSMLKPEYKLSTREVHKLYKECYQLLKAYNQYCLPRGIPGINSILANEYVQFYMDLVLSMFGYLTLFERKDNPFSWMQGQGLDKIHSFFERENGTYTRAKDNIGNSINPYENDQIDDKSSSNLDDLE